MKLTSYLVSLSIFLVSDTIAFADPMPPTQTEKIHLTIPHCSQFTIIEWRGDPDFPKWTTPNPQTLQVLEEVCYLALKTFPEFTGYKIKKSFKFSLALMPFSLERSGQGKRNLNDIKNRFKYRNKSYNQGEVVPILGYTQHNQRIIYLRHDVLWLDQPNPDFKITLIHEMFHALSYHHGLYASHPGDKNQADEIQAQQFVDWLRLQRLL
jgi:hypothetical protein